MRFILGATRGDASLLCARGGGLKRFGLHNDFKGELYGRRFPHLSGELFMRAAERFVFRLLLLGGEVEWHVAVGG